MSYTDCNLFPLYIQEDSHDTHILSLHRHVICTLQHIHTILTNKCAQAKVDKRHRILHEDQYGHTRRLVDCCSCIPCLHEIVCIAPSRLQLANSVSMLGYLLSRSSGHMFTLFNTAQISAWTRTRWSQPALETEGR